MALLVCALVTKPYAEMGINDDWSYIRSAQVLAQTGHLAYNGWATAMLGWQIYLGALMVKLFGFSFSILRLTELLIGMATSFLLQRTFVRTGLREWNATVATLAIVLSPLFLPLAVSFMTDVSGVFAIVLCLYACIRALQAETTGGASGWIAFAAISNGISGNVRQIAWLGVLVMVPSTLWLLRRHRRVLITGLLSGLCGVGIIVATLHWYNRQPYSLPEPLLQEAINKHEVLRLFHYVRLSFLELGFLLVPVLLIFVPAMRFRSRRAILAVGVVVGLFLLSAIFMQHRGHALAAPPFLGNILTIHGGFDTSTIQGNQPVYLRGWERLALSTAEITGVCCFAVTLLGWMRSRKLVSAETTVLPWRELLVLLVPFTVCYFALLFPRATYSLLFDRYMLPLMMVAVCLMTRFYQDCLELRLPFITLVLVLLFSAYGIMATHDTFAMYRARVAVIDELRGSGVPAVAIDGGWEYGTWVQTIETGHVNDRRIRVPANAYVPLPIESERPCHPMRSDMTPQMSPRFALSFDPNICAGGAPFAPVTYHTWLSPHSATIYVVRYNNRESRLSPALP